MQMEVFVRMCYPLGPFGLIPLLLCVDLQVVQSGHMLQQEAWINQYPLPPSIICLALVTQEPLCTWFVFLLWLIFRPSGCFCCSNFILCFFKAYGSLGSIKMNIEGHTNSHFRSLFSEKCENAHNIDQKKLLLFRTSQLVDVTFLEKIVWMITRF